MEKIEKSPSQKELEVVDFGFYWSGVVSFLCLYLIYSIILGYFGIFNWILLLAGFFVLFFIFRLHSRIMVLFTLIFSRIDLLKFILIIVAIIWMTLLALFFSDPYFSGRDEGSYANAAIELANSGSMFFKPAVLTLLSNEGPAHQALNFPGFVIKEGSLTSQFSPAYFVYLAIFYLFSGGTFFWSLANGFLVLLGAIVFYNLLKYFFSRFIALAGFLLLISNFSFIWFPRFTFSENMAFFIFWNLIFFLTLFYFTKDQFIRRKLILSIILLCIVFPLVRPEGWWIFLMVAIFSVCLRKEIFKTLSPKSFWTIAPVGLFGVLLSIYVFYLESPVYKRLFKDWIKWPKSQEFYMKIRSGDYSLSNAKEAFLSTFPPVEKMVYFWKVEWNYGILLFGILAIIGFVIFILGARRKSSYFFSGKERKFIKILFFLSFPLFFAFVSPQISSDHPWMLRRFFFAVLPSGIFLGVMLVKKFSQKFSKRFFYLAPVLLALLFVPSFMPSSYFLTIKQDSGRENVFRKLGQIFSKNDYVFLHRDASGDGWKMFAGPLMSVYGLNAVYVYQPENVINNKKIIEDGWYQGKKTYLVLPEGAFDFEHQLRKEFDLSLECELPFSNAELDINKKMTSVAFPLLVKKDYKVLVYLLSPK